MYREIPEGEISYQRDCFRAARMCCCFWQCQRRAGRSGRVERRHSTMHLFLRGMYWIGKVFSCDGDESEVIYISYLN